MKAIRSRLLCVLSLTVFGLTMPGLGDDWPMWGRTPSRNMSNPAERGLAIDF